MSFDLNKNGSPVASLPPPQPKSPPRYPDLYGKRRELAKVQMLEREIGFLEEELKSMDSLQPASRSCKEIADFVIANADPLIPTTKKIRTSCRFWKWLCSGVSYFSVSWLCCCKWSMGRCCCCCDCSTCDCCNVCADCRILPKCHCLSGWNSRCFTKWKCRPACCIPKCPSCQTCSFPSCECCPKCPNLNICSCNSHNRCCCNSCFYCM
ncbi:hypothetical protein ACS0TY_022079 [Phlomoides rotata]